MNLSRLKEPFHASDIEWRIAQSGGGERGPWAKILAYITARACQDRLDEVFGPLGWKCEYIPQDFTDRDKRESAFICRLSVIRDDGQWIYKEDGAGLTDFEAFKGGISGAFKRVCASGYGIGRYLYGLSEVWAECSDAKQAGYEYAKPKDGKAFYWRVPANALPAWALPEGSATNNEPEPQQEHIQQTLNDNPIVGVVANVAKRNFHDTTKNRDVPFWVIKMSTGEEIAAWDGEVGMLAESSVGKMVSISWELSKRGKKNVLEFALQR